MGLYTETRYIFLDERVHLTNRKNEPADSWHSQNCHSSPRDFVTNLYWIRVLWRFQAQVQRLDSWKGRGVTSKLVRKPESQCTKSLYKLPASSLNVVSLARQRSLSDGSESDAPTPPPSVWKVPEYVEPKWNPGKPENGSPIPKRPLKETRLNNDVVREKVRPEAPFNQLHNPVHATTTPSNVKNQLMNQKGQVTNPPDVDARYSVLKGVDKRDKPDNRQTSGYSSFSGLPNLLSQLQRNQDTAESKPYTLFGPDQPNSSIFRSPLSGQ